MARTKIAPGVYKDENGEYYIDENELRSGPSVGDDSGYGDDDDFGIDRADDAFGDDDAAAMSWLMGEIGRARPGSRKHKKAKERFNRRADRLEKRAARKGVDLDIGTEPEDKKVWQSTAVAGAETMTAAGEKTIKIRVQHDFRASDIRALGLADARITEIRFGDRGVWSSDTGVNISFLGANSFMTGMLKNQFIRGGLDISVKVSFPGAGTVEVTIPGEKPASC